MDRKNFRLTVLGVALAASGAAMAKPPGTVQVGPPAGVRHGPPAGVTAGPPAAATARVPAVATARIPQGNATGQTARATQGGGNAAGKAAAPGLAKAPKDVQRGASLLKKLNAAHASDRALEHASDKSIVGAIAEYKEDTKQALADIEVYTGKVEDGLDAVADAQQAVDAAQGQVTSAQTAVNTAQTELDAAKATLANANTDLTNANTTLTSAQEALAADQAKLAEAQTQLDGAKTELADRSGVEMTPEVVERLNDLLDL